MNTPGSTWAHTYDFTATTLEHPESVDELQRLVAANPRVRALGSRHSFTALADTPGVLIALDAMPHDVEVEGSTVRVSAGLRYGDVAAELQSRGLALHNLA